MKEGEKFYVGVGPGEVIPENPDGSLDFNLTKPVEVELKPEKLEYEIREMIKDKLQLLKQGQISREDARRIIKEEIDSIFSKK